MATTKTTKSSKTAKKAAPAKSRASAKATSKPAEAKPEIIQATPQTKTQKVKAAVPRPHVVVTGFLDFLREQSVVGLAIGLVMGTQVKQLVDSLLNSFINPLIGLVLPGQGALSQKTVVLHFRHKIGDFTWGAFAANLISFITVAAVVYLVFKALQLDKLTKKKTA